MLKQKNKSRKVALYTPYLDVLGGGEFHVLSILKTLEEFGFEAFIFWDDNLQIEIERNLGIKFKDLKFLPNIFKRKSFFKNALYLSKFDIFIYVPNGSYFFSLAKKNFLFCMVPKKDLYPQNFLSKVKLWNFKILANSQFTANYLRNWLNKDVKVIYPFLPPEILNLKVDFSRKEERILNVGRFFKQLHSKKQDKIIKWFKKIIQEEDMLNKIKLYLAGGLKEEDRQYYNYVLNLSLESDRVFVKINLTKSEILSLFIRSKYYWHFTGLGEDGPEKQEHFGISILEAMVTGCIVFAYKNGGPIEIIQDGETGFLFKDYNELKKKFLECYKNKDLQFKVFLKARKFVRKNFSYENFKNRVREIFEV